MNKKKLIREIANRTGFSICISKKIVDSLIQTICCALKRGERVSLKDFGVFCNIEKQSKRYYDIPAGKIKTYPTKRVVKFIPYKRFKERLFIKTLDFRKEDDGSIGNSIVLEKKIFSAPLNSKIRTSEKNYTNVKPIFGEKNVSQRVTRQAEIDTSDLFFEGNFLFDHFIGEGEHNKFPSIKVSHEGTPILVPRIDKIGATIGVMEPVLLAHLYNMCKEINGIKILENVKLPILNRNYSYRPDFCLYWKEKKLYIDIEIDEPYDIVSRKPIHYLKNGDDLRDRYFIRNGWCVIRFAEQQIKDNIEGVINYIKRVLRWLTEDSEIQFYKDTLDSIDRWSYEEAIEMSSSNVREHYLDLPHYVSPDESLSIDNVSGLRQDISTFIKPAEDILPELATIQKECEWLSIVNNVKQSNCEYCIVTRVNGYHWIFTCESLKILSKGEQSIITGESPLGFDVNFPLEDLVEIAPLKNLFSDVHWENHSSIEDLEKILFDTIANGKPIWIAYNSDNSGFSTRFLSNLAYCNISYYDVVYYDAPHIGLGHCLKYGMYSLTHFHAFCSNRKEFRMFAADGRIQELKVLNCDHVYYWNEEYANSFARLVMHPYEPNNGHAFFENADEILRIMPRNEFESLLLQGNLANFQVMKGEISKAIATYQQKPYNFLVTPSLTWGEACMSDIKFFINLCNEHVKDQYFPEKELDANIIKRNFEEALGLLTKSHWMQD